MDDVKRLLEGFADQAAEGLPDADIEADVARGRRALRRIKRRRRVTGVLCVAAVSAVALAVGNQVKWWGTGDSEVAGTTAEPKPAASTNTPATSTPAPSGETMSMFGASVVELVTNKESWSVIDCGLAPKGWSAETPITNGRVVLSQPRMRTADATAKVVLQAAPQARSLGSVRVTEGTGKTFHIGTLNGRTAGQVKLPGQWLLVELPAGTVEWPDETLVRFMDSCTIN